MSFPVVLQLGAQQVSAHFLFECLAYLVGFALYRRARRAGDRFDDSTRWSLILGALLGALLGSKVLHHLAQPSLWSETHGLQGWLEGKTIVGGLLGGLLATELLKKRWNIVHSTGDLYALPLALGMAVGRLGCFSAGLEDGTHGLPSELPWALDLGDGIARHPAPLYEAGGLLVLALWLRARARRGFALGTQFRWFLGGYCGLRFACDFIKPVELLAGLGVLQWACLAGLAWSVWPRRASARP